MSRISVSNLTFNYDNSAEYVFENLYLTLDTDWKLGLIGRNGKGKTTFLNLLMGKYEYSGKISSNAGFDYFPYEVNGEQEKLTASELIDLWKPGVEEWKVICELTRLELEADVLYRPFETLSYGEKSKVMLAVLFSGENDFLLIDEPTNHLDINARDVIGRYLGSKKGFILVSHDRKLLDECVDHVLVLNRETIEIQSGNFSSWWENKEKKDRFAIAENEKHLKEIDKLQAAMSRTSNWAGKSEESKIGFDPIKEHDRYLDTRAYIGSKTKKMQARVKSFEKRVEREVEENRGKLKDIERVGKLKLIPQNYNKSRLVRLHDYSGMYDNERRMVLNHITLEIKQGDICFLIGNNGCGKSTMLKAILNASGYSKELPDNYYESGEIETASGLVISYVSQDTSMIKGSLKDYASEKHLDYSLLLTILQKLGMNRTQFNYDMENFSEGQKKKVLIAASLISKAHLYIWDEPLNYIDVFSRMQIEDMIKEYAPTMLIVEHDSSFRENINGSSIYITPEGMLEER